MRTRFLSSDLGPRAVPAAHAPQSLYQTRRVPQGLRSAAACRLSRSDRRRLEHRQPDSRRQTVRERSDVGPPVQYKFLWACLGLLAPGLAGLSSRWQSVLIWAASVVLLSIGMGQSSWGSRGLTNEAQGSSFVPISVWSTKGDVVADRAPKGDGLEGGPLRAKALTGRVAHGDRACGRTGALGQAGGNDVGVEGGWSCGSGIR